jgi:hypothetical protein
VSKYKPGKSGNPKGRPTGRPDRRSRFRELIQDAVPELIDKALQLAREGDIAALRLLLERAVPPIKAESEVSHFAYSPGATLSDSAGAIIATVAAGNMSPEAGKALLDSLQAHSRLIETDDLIKRIQALERMKESGNGT